MVKNTFMSFCSTWQKEKRESNIWETYKNMAHSPYSILLEFYWKTFWSKCQSLSGFIFFFFSTYFCLSFCMYSKKTTDSEEIFKRRHHSKYKEKIKKLVRNSLRETLKKIWACSNSKRYPQLRNQVSEMIGMEFILFLVLTTLILVKDLK